MTTISARFSPEQLKILKKHQSEMNVSKTAVLHKALEQLELTAPTSRVRRIEVLISADTLRRVVRLHEYYNLGTSLEALLSEALELGIRQIRARHTEDRKEDAELARLDMDARSIEMQQDSMTQ